MTHDAESTGSNAGNLRTAAILVMLLCVVTCNFYDYLYFRRYYPAAGAIYPTLAVIRFLLSAWPIGLLFFARQRWMMVALCVFYAVLAIYVAYAFHVIVPDAIRQGYHFGWWLDYALILWGAVASAFIALWKVITLF